VNVWNALPEAVVGARSLKALKAELTKDDSLVKQHLRGRALK